MRNETIKLVKFKGFMPPSNGYYLVKTISRYGRVAYFASKLTINPDNGDYAVDVHNQDIILISDKPLETSNQ